MSQDTNEHKLESLEKIVKNLDANSTAECSFAIRDFLIQCSSEERAKLSALLKGFFGDELAEWQEKKKTEAEFNEKVRRATDIYVYRNGVAAASGINPYIHWNIDGNADIRALHQHGLSLVSRLEGLGLIPAEQFEALHAAHAMAVEHVSQSNGCTADFPADYKLMFLETFQAINRAMITAQFEPDVFAAIPFDVLPKMMTTEKYMKGVRPPLPIPFHLTAKIQAS